MAVGTGGGESVGEENVLRSHKSEVKPGAACRIKLGANLGHTLVACNSTWGTGAVVSFSWACHGIAVNHLYTVAMAPFGVQRCFN